MPAPHAANGLEWLTVLVVDDNRHFRNVVRNLLRLLKVNEVVEASTVPAASEILKTDPIDLVLTGLVMKPVDGIKLVKWMRQSEGANFQALPVIGMTLHTNLETIVKARDAGISEILAKPLSAQQLERHIKVVLNVNRDFIRDNTFVGPDRRRHIGQLHHGAERREAEPIGKT